MTTLETPIQPYTNLMLRKQFPGLYAYVRKQLEASTRDELERRIIDLVSSFDGRIAPGQEFPDLELAKTQALELLPKFWQAIDQASTVPAEEGEAWYVELANQLSPYSKGKALFANLPSLK